jgi:hypothetical protein
MLAYSSDASMLLELLEAALVIMRMLP